MNNQTFSGIEVLGNMSWGTHFCQFYETKTDLLKILVPYFKTGLENDEFCLWITSDPIDVKEATRALKKAVPELDRYNAARKIEILSHDNWYLHQGKFSPRRVSKGWNTKLSQALEKGFKGMRVSGNAGWIDKGVGKDFIEYERGLEQFLVDKRMVVLCTYPLKKCSASDVMNVAHVHECAISNRNGQWEIIEVPAIKKTKAQMQRINEDLEQRVKERTIELAKTNKELRNLSAHLHLIQENERTTIAREIHDELGQQLTALKMEIGWLNKKLPDEVVLKEKGNEILSLVSEMLKTVKRIALELRPNILDELGLVAALEWQGQEFEKHTGIKFQFHMALNGFSPERNLSTNIFRVYQEALTNIARHAQATSVETSIEKKDDYLLLEIKDDGKGFNVREEKNKNSFGLIGMEERALMFHGEFAIDSATRKGTVITLKVPILKIDKGS